LEKRNIDMKNTKIFKMLRIQFKYKYIAEPKLEVELEEVNNYDFKQLMPYKAPL
jgi:hypothetical protein